MSTVIDLGRPLSGDIIDLILADHYRFEDLLRRLRNTDEDRDALRQAFMTLHVAHSQAEEHGVVAGLRRAADSISAHDEEHADEEHAEGHEALLTLMELKGTQTKAFDTAVKELSTTVVHHLVEEELTILNPARGEVGLAKRRTLGEAWAAERNRIVDEGVTIEQLREIVAAAEKKGLLPEEPEGDDKK